jgi:DNA-binding MarR family transcriptional regulator
VNAPDPDLDPVVDDPGITTFGLLLEAHARLSKVLDVELRASDGITLQTYEVLLRVGRAPQGWVTMSDLADVVTLTTGGVTRLADRLEADGLVERGSCPTDRRVVHLTLTRKGRTLLRRASAHHVEALDRHLESRLDPADRCALDRSLDQLRRSCDEWRPGTAHVPADAAARAGD